jgi:hypothetical protein
MTNPVCLADLRRQAFGKLSELRAARDRENRLLAFRRDLPLTDDRLPGIDASQLALVKVCRDLEAGLGPLQEEIAELEAAQRAADAVAQADASAVAIEATRAAVERRLHAAAAIDAAMEVLKDAFGCLDTAGNELARHEKIHGVATMTIFNGRRLRAAVNAASDGSNLAKALEITNYGNGSEPLLQAETELWRAFLPAKSAAA